MTQMVIVTSPCIRMANDPKQDKLRLTWPILHAQFWCEKLPRLVNRA